MMEKKKVNLDEMTEEMLKQTHPLYDKYLSLWNFLNAAYEGVENLVDYGSIIRHERESLGNYRRRLEELYGFNYSQSIIDLFNSYLFNKEYPRFVPEVLSNNDSWVAFQEDSDMNGIEFDEFFIDSQRQASIQGHVGILVDRPRYEAENKKEEKQKHMRAYVSLYHPTAILDWQFEKQPNGVKKLTYLKLYDDDGFYHIWTLEKWEVWRLVEKEQNVSVNVVKEGPQSKKESTGLAAFKLDEGENTLGLIPFTFLFNQRNSIDKEIGSSDIKTIAKIDVSIIRNLSQIEEIINYAAFPMMRKPMKEAGTPTNLKDEVGPTAVLEFDPEKWQAKPDWLKSEVEGPINAILKTINGKVSEIYRSSNVGGMASMEVGTQAKSGAALKAEFHLLNSKLIRKSKNVVRAKRSVAYHWLLWEGLEVHNEELTFDFVISFDVEDLMTDLENLLTSSAIVKDSVTFYREVQKKAVRLIIPSAEDEFLAQIDSEIDEAELPGNGLDGFEDYMDNLKDAPKIDNDETTTTNEEDED